MTSTFLWYSILVVCIILVLNFTTGVFFYVKRTKLDPPVILSPQQKKLLGVKNDGKKLLELIFFFKILFCT